MLLQNTVTGFPCCFSIRKPYLDVLQHLALLTVSHVGLEESGREFSWYGVEGALYLLQVSGLAGCVIRTVLSGHNLVPSKNRKAECQILFCQELNI